MMYRVIVNPNSGRGKGVRYGKELDAVLTKKALPHEIYFTKAKGNAKEIAAEFRGDTLIAVGGDGTFHEVLNGMDTETCELGFIPCGRGNDFAATLGVPKKPKDALDAILSGEKTAIDYIEVGDNLRCLNVGGTGLDIDVLKGVENKHDSKFTYLKSLIYCIYHFTPYELDVEIDGKSEHFSCVMAGVCNGKQFGGGIKISPNSSLSSGILNVIVAEFPGKKHLMRALMGFTRGTHLDKPYVHCYECERVKISSPYNYPIELDGEIYYDTPLDCRVKKAGLKTFIKKK